MATVTESKVIQFADMFAALGAEPRLRIMRLLLCPPDGMVVSEIQAETGIAGSTLSQHLEKLKNDDLVTAEREKAFIRYRANTAALGELLGFLYAECCTRTKAIEPAKIAALCNDGIAMDKDKVRDWPPRARRNSADTMSLTDL